MVPCISFAMIIFLGKNENSLKNGPSCCSYVPLKIGKKWSVLPVATLLKTWYNANINISANGFKSSIFPRSCLPLHPWTAKKSIASSLLTLPYQKWFTFYLDRGSLGLFPRRGMRYRELIFTQVRATLPCSQANTEKWRDTE